MKVLMFGWEFPPHISGGLGTACYGLTKALSVFPGLDLTFVVPKIWGDEPGGGMQLLGASEIDLLASKIKAEEFKTPFTYLSVQSGMLPYIDPTAYPEAIKEAQKKFSEPSKQDPFESIRFTGAYHTDLLTEIHNFSVVSEHISRQQDYDVIHAHDWLTYPAGIKAKQATGKPLVIHVHATDFDRSGGNANPDVYNIEKAGMDAADRIIAVSNHTKKIIIEKYFINKAKVTAVHNGVEPFTANEDSLIKTKKKHRKTVTFLGRVTMQKGPQYFVEVARKILSRMQDIEFVMAGSGDLLQEMITLVDNFGLRENFSFPGFLKGPAVRNCLKHSDVFIMPSVSEPFGICPLEAMFCKVPVIISKQSGVSEVVQHSIKVDFWDTDAMADAVYSILTRRVLRKKMRKGGANEVIEINWEKSALKIADIYGSLLRA
ncbi:glycosyltransferase family 4 protein [Draconibacterium mangrovi]|uniref:glycosyltransferase family 4 protein n=1 Tax=Draconibacterium mangrovi TaxID=2697469 RepID=UPI0013D170D0|nr:glycosyltransferase family 4 protein [Draconibacterium mangrovi]